jgi:hypothetical protein
MPSASTDQLVSERKSNSVPVMILLPEINSPSSAHQVASSQRSPVILDHRLPFWRTSYG